jgi:hypothetical protein
VTLDETLCFAINHFGSGGHPAATPENIDTFGAEYVKDCVAKALASGKISASAAARLKAFIDER